MQHYGEITETVPEPRLATYKSPFLVSKATNSGIEPTVKVATTVLVAPSITETVSECAFVTYKSPFLVSKATPTGFEPTVTVATTVLVAKVLGRWGR